MRRFTLTLSSILVCRTLCAGPAVDFSGQVAPVLRSYCAGCHNAEDREGDFSLETYAALREGGDEGDPLAASDGKEPLLLRLIERRDKPHMPPKDEPQLPAEDLGLLQRWVAEGAPGPEEDRSILQELVVPEIAAGGSRPMTALEFSPDGQSMAWNGAEVVVMGALRAEENGRQMQDSSASMNALHFSPDSALLVGATGITGLNGVARIWDPATGEKVREFAGHRDVLYDAAFSPDGTLLATAGYDRSIRIWNVAEGELLRVIDVHKGAVFDLAWHPSGKVLASASADETVKLWRASDGVRLDTLNQPQGEQNAVLFTPDGRYVISAGADQRLHMWRLVSVDSPELNPVLHSRFAHDAPIVAIALSPDGRFLVSSAEDGVLKLWSVPELEELHAYERQPDIAGVIAIEPDGSHFHVGRMDGSTGSYAIGPFSREGAVGVASAEVAAAAAVAAAGATGEPVEFSEAEPNDAAHEANGISLPAGVKGAITAGGDADLFRFRAEAGRMLTLEVNAARDQSQLDSFLEVLHGDGSPVEQVVLQATRDSWLTFRGKDSFTSDDFRVHNWREMELNEYLYCNGEVVKLWHYPRGPDSGFKVYPGGGNRETYFNTTALAHPLGQPCYTVAALPPGSQPAPNGLPVIRLHYENDDDPQRRFGSDSHLLFTAPSDGEYLVRVSDRRGFGARERFHYTLTVRDQRPDFSASIGGRDAMVPRGGGMEFPVNLQRSEGFAGPVRIDIGNLPAGFSASTPLTVQAGQFQALGLLVAAPDAVDPGGMAAAAVTITATALLNGVEVVRELGGFGNLRLGDPPGMQVQVLAADGGENPRFRIRPGETINARVRIDRGNYGDIIDFGNHDSGRNLPHGVFVDNIGLNGLLLLGGQSEREFQITASPIAARGEREFHLKTGSGGGAVSQRVRLEVIE